MNRIHEWIGYGDNLTAFQMSARAAIMFVIMLILIRIGGVRIFGKRSGFDTIIMMTMGSIVAHGIVSASPFWQRLLRGGYDRCASAVWITFFNRILETLIKGTPLTLYKDGRILSNNLRKGLFDGRRSERKFAPRNKGHVTGKNRKRPVLKQMGE